MQINKLYLGMAIILTIIALMLGLPSGLIIGRKYALIAANILNFKIYNFQIPPLTLSLEILTVMLIPILTALYPIIKNTRIAVHQVINNYGINPDNTGNLIFSFIPGRLKSISRPLLLSIRNTFRRKGRLIFTILVMAAAGTAFITAMNIYAAMYHKVDTEINSYLYDIQIIFESPQKKEIVNNVFNKIPGVVKYEIFVGDTAYQVNSDNTLGKPLEIIGISPTTKLIKKPELEAGRWIQPADKNTVVINQRLLSGDQEIKVGEEIHFEVPLEYVVSTSGIAFWLFIVIVFASLASYYPSQQASELSIKDALVYE